MSTARIGVIEDDIVARRILQIALTSLGHHVDVYGRAEDLIAMFAPHTYDVIISDFSLPGMDGATLLKWIRQSDDEVVLVLLTGSASLEAIKFVLEDCRVDYLLKPIRPSDLQILLSNALATTPHPALYHTAARHVG